MQTQEDRCQDEATGLLASLDFWSGNFIIIILACINDVYVKYFETTKSAHALPNKGEQVGRNIRNFGYLPTEYKVFINEIVNLSALVFYNSI